MAIEKLKQFVKESLAGDRTGHGFDHAQRVWKLCLRIAENHASADLETLEIACLLHDISFKEGIIKKHHLASAEMAAEILKDWSYPEEKIKKVQEIIRDHVGHMVESERPNEELPLESKILRDADNLDALGAIGIMRMVSFSLTQDIPYFISEEDKLDETYYGNIHFLMDWPKRMFTKEAKTIAYDKIYIMRMFLYHLKREAV